MVVTILDNLNLFLLILLRMSGAILVNPIFGRRNVPNLVKAGLVLSLSYILTISCPLQNPQSLTIFEFVFKGLTEFAIGYAIALIMYMFLSVIAVACDLIDMQIGISMAKAYDSGSSTSYAVTASVYNSFLILLFFVTNGHMTLYNLLKDSLVAIPCGANIDITSAAYALVLVFGNVITLAVKFALPIIAVEFITEMGLGILTRVVPSVNIFSIGIQLRFMIGIVVLALMAPLFGAFCDSLFSEMFSEVYKTLNYVQVS